MTHADKVKKVMAENNLSLEEATDTVHFLDWVVEEKEFLESIHPQFQKDFNTELPFIGMCELLWKDESTNVRAEYFAIKNIN